MEERGVDLEFVSTAGDLGIWLKIIEVEDRELGREGESIRKQVIKREWRLVGFQLPFHNKYNVLKCVKLNNGSST